MNITAAAIHHTAYAAPSYSGGISGNNIDGTVRDVKDKENTAKPELEDGSKMRPMTPRYDEFVRSSEAANESQTNKNPAAENKDSAPVQDGQEKETSGLPEPPKETSGNKKPEGKNCTVNTDKVDAEIERLKEEMQRLEMQISQADDDPEKAKELERKKSALEAELRTKDNDNYRKQHATYTYQ